MLLTSLPTAQPYHHTATLLSMAIKNDDVAAVRTIVEQGFPIAQYLKNGVGSSALKQAAFTGRLAMCMLLIELGADLNTPSPSCSVLWHALRAIPHHATAIPIVHALLVSGAEPNELSALVSTGASLREARLKGEEKTWHPSEDGLLALAALMIDKGASPSFLPEQLLPGHLTPFQDAVRLALPRFIVFFVTECGEDPTQCAIDGRTMFAIARRSPATKELLHALTTERSLAKMLTSDAPLTAPRRPSDRAPSPL